jgi:uncharacterized protein YabE (DUF348 family)/3D (Asp-Asp-Asp) domain-containing protein
MRKGRTRRKRIIATAVVLAVALVFSVSITAYAINSRAVLIRDNEEEYTYNTTKTDVYDILRAKAITLGNDDYLDLSGFRPEEDYCVIRIYRAKNVWLEDDGVRRQYVCAGWVGRLLELNGIVLGERDKINCDLYDLLAPDMEITIHRAFDVEVRDYGHTYNLTLTEGTVAQALELSGVTLEGMDYVEPGLSTPLQPGLTIHVSRVSYRERTAIAEIDFEVDSSKSNKVDLGVVKIEQKGEKGEKKTVYNDKYVNGQRVDSIVMTEEIRKEPVKEIRVIGTRVARLTPGATPISRLSPPSSLKLKNGVPTHYSRAVSGLAKAYSGGKGTASGLRPIMPGHIAVNPRQFPYGSQLWIVSNDGKYVYGYAIAADTGGFVKTNSCMVDLYMPNNGMARQWGARGVTVYVLDEPRVYTPYG